MSRGDGFAVGDLIRDNDPRSPDRVLEIARVENNFVVAARRGFNRTVRIKRSRIYTDGKPRRSGFTLVTTGVES